MYRLIYNDTNDTWRSLHSANKYFTRFKPQTMPYWFCLNLQKACFTCFVLLKSKHFSPFLFPIDYVLQYLCVVKFCRDFLYVIHFKNKWLSLYLLTCKSTSRQYESLVNVNDHKGLIIGR